MLEGLLAQPLGPGEQLEVLESARQTITFVQHEMSSRYAAHLPPDSAEDATLRRVVRAMDRPQHRHARLAEHTATVAETSSGPKLPLLARQRIRYLGR